MSQSQAEIEHDYIIAREAAKKHEGTDVGDYWAEKRDDLLKQMPDMFQIMIKLGGQEDDLGRDE